MAIKWWLWDWHYDNLIFRSGTVFCLINEFHEKVTVDTKRGRRAGISAWRKIVEPSPHMLILVGERREESLKSSYALDAWAKIILISIEKTKHSVWSDHFHLKVSLPFKLILNDLLSYTSHVSFSILHIGKLSHPISFAGRKAVF